MKDISLFRSVFFAGLLSLEGAVWAETKLVPVVASVKGTITVSHDNGAATPVFSQQAVPLGSELFSGTASSALISVTPGISAIMKSRTELLLKAAEINAAERYGELELVRGAVVCRLKKQAGLKQRFRLVMGAGEYSQAAGTVWQASCKTDKHSVAVLEGTVIWVRVPGVGEVSVPAGAVLLSKYETKGGVTTLISVVLVNLLDATYTEYPMDGSRPVTATATSAQLEEARDVFSEAVGDEFENLKSDEKTSLLSLLFDVNKSLAQAGVPVVSAPTAAGVPPAGVGAVTSNNPADATSPITPP